MEHLQSCMPSQFGRNVRHLLQVTGVQANRLAKAVDVGPATVNDWTSGKTQSVDAANLIKVANFFALRPETLLQNDLSHLAREDLATYATTPIVDALLTRVPVVGTTAVDSSEASVEPKDSGGHVLFPTSDVEAYSLRVLGDGMRPRFKPGEFVIAEPHRQAEPGHEVVIKTDDGRTLVKVFDWSRGGLVQLSSVNEAHAPVTIPSSAITTMHRIVGVVQADLELPRPDFLQPSRSGGL